MKEFDLNEKKETMENELASRFTTDQLEEEIERRKDKKFNLSEKIREFIINENDLQKGTIEFSYTGELVPLEKVENDLKEFIRLLKYNSAEVNLDHPAMREIAVLMGVVDGEEHKRLAVIDLDELDKLAGKDLT